jgi:hypothetical protein
VGQNRFPLANEGISKELRDIELLVERMDILWVLFVVRFLIMFCIQTNIDVYIMQESSDLGTLVCI